MGDQSPLVSIHDQGAGGPANVLKELVEKAGGKIKLRHIKLGDPILSVLKNLDCRISGAVWFLDQP